MVPQNSDRNTVGRSESADPPAIDMAHISSDICTAMNFLTQFIMTISKLTNPDLATLPVLEMTLVFVETARSVLAGR